MGPMRSTQGAYFLPPDLTSQVTTDQGRLHEPHPHTLGPGVPHLWDHPLALYFKGQAGQGPQPCLPAEPAESSPEHPPEGPAHPPQHGGPPQGEAPHPPGGTGDVRVHSLLLTHGTVATATAEGLGHPALTPTPLRRCSVRSCLREEELVEGGAHRAPPPGLTWCRVPPTATPTGPADRVSCASPAPVGPQGAGAPCPSWPLTWPLTWR